LWIHEEVRVADFLDAHAAEHLPHDDLDVLVVDADAQQAVNLLDFVYEPGREPLLTVTKHSIARETAGRDASRVLFSRHAALLELNPDYRIAY